MGELQSKDIVNLQDVGDGRKRKRFEARIEQRLLTTSETECIDNSNLQNRAGLEDLSVSHTQRLEEKSEAESLLHTFYQILAMQILAMQRLWFPSMMQS